MIVAASQHSGDLHGEAPIIAQDRPAVTRGAR